MGLLAGDFGIGHGATIGAMANNCVSFYLVFEIIRRAGPVIFSTVNYIATLSGMGFGCGSSATRPRPISGARSS